MSLARGPVLFAGVVLFVFGLTGLPVNSDFPSSSGQVQGETWLGIEGNGWTWFVILAAGGALLFGAAQHVLAKLTALLVGGALAACCVIALADGDMLGYAATNGATALAFGVAAAYLIGCALLKRRTREIAAPPAPVTAEPVAAPLRELEDEHEHESVTVVHSTPLARR